MFWCSEISLLVESWGLSWVRNGKQSTYQCRRLGSIPVSQRSPGEGNGNSPLYSCLENHMDRGAWWATVHGVTNSWTWLSDWTTTTINRVLRKGTHSLNCFMFTAVSLQPLCLKTACLDLVSLTHFFFPWMSCVFHYFLVLCMLVPKVWCKPDFCCW